MNETDVNSNIESEEVESAIYSSTFLMNRDLYYDFSSVSYNKIKKMFGAFLCLFVCAVTINLLNRDYDIVISYCILISFLMILSYCLTTKRIKIGYERMVISAGKEIPVNCELFDDKIVSCGDGAKREHFYNQITKFFESKNFILLHLQHNLYLTLEKNNLNASVDEVKSFLMNKCTLVKAKRFINCFDDKKWCLIFLIAIVGISVAAIVVSLVLKLNSVF